MGFDEGRIILDSPNGAYYSGQTVCGRLEFDLQKVKKFRGIYVDLKGYCKVHWSTSHTRRVNDRRETYTVSHDSYEDYFNRRIYLVGGKEGEHHLEPGHYVFSFECELPVSCPSSFEGSHGHIRYEVKAVVDRAFKFDQEKHATIRVIAPLDLNLNPFCKEPISIDITNSFCCCFVGSGSSETLIKLPVSGYCPGQVMPIEVCCTNKSNVGIDDIKFALNREITFHAEQNPGSRTDEDVIAEIKTGQVPGNNTRNWTIEMSVPAMDVYNFDNCRYIDVHYYFKAIVGTESCHEDGVDSHKLIIGNIPLRGFQDNVENPMKDQMPQQPYVPQNPQNNPGYPIVNQPLPSNTPYPAPNNAYPVNSTPNPQSPYPPQPNASPYPQYQTPAPYPGGNPNMNNPYGGSSTNIANVGPNSPYPSPNMGPAVGPNSPYPPSPNIGARANVSYQTSPNIGANTGSPYPGSLNVGPNTQSGSSPYNSRGPSPLPYPVNQGPAGGSFLKTGVIGFAMQGTDKSNDGASMPLLPPGASVPYASPKPANPYASASAPTPSTPDKEENEGPKGSPHQTSNAPYP